MFTFHRYWSVIGRDKIGSVILTIKTGFSYQSGDIAQFHNLNLTDLNSFIFIAHKFNGQQKSEFRGNMEYYADLHSICTYVLINSEIHCMLYLLSQVHKYGNVWFRVNYFKDTRRPNHTHHTVNFVLVFNGICENKNQLWLIAAHLLYFQVI